jgi:hypothetical protein
MVSDLYAFLWALLPHWWVFLSSGPAAVDRVLRNHWAAYAAWADRRLDADARARLFRRIAFGGIFIAGFLAFRDEHHQAIEARRVADRAADKRARIYPSIYFQAAAELHDKLNGVLAAHPGSWVWLGYVDNPSSVQLVEALGKSIKRPNLMVQGQPVPEDNINGEGITLFVRNPSNENPDEKKIIEAFHSSGFIDLKLDQINKDPGYAGELFGVYVSYPPLE